MPQRGGVIIAKRLPRQFARLRVIFAQGRLEAQRVN
jgi:hypothetical protein